MKANRWTVVALVAVLGIVVAVVLAGMTWMLWPTPARSRDTEARATINRLIEEADGPLTDGPRLLDQARLIWEEVSKPWDDAAKREPDPVTAMRARDHVERLCNGATEQDPRTPGRRIMTALEDRGYFDALERAVKAGGLAKRWTGGASFSNELGSHLGLAQFDIATSLTLSARLRACHDAQQDLELASIADTALGLGQGRARGMIGLDLMLGISHQCLFLAEIRYLLREREPSAQACRDLIGVIERRCAFPACEVPCRADIACSIAIAAASGNLSEREVIRLEKRFDILAKFFCGHEGRPVIEYPEFPNHFDDSWLPPESVKEALERAHVEWNTSLRMRAAHRLAVDGTRLMLALAAFRSEQGVYPPTLDALAPRYLPVIPEDPVTGKPLAYRVLDPAATTASGYALYSLGLDGLDDGGVKDRVAPRSLAASIFSAPDHIINEPRRDWRASPPSSP